MIGIPNLIPIQAFILSQSPLYNITPETAVEEAFLWPAAEIDCLFSASKSMFGWEKTMRLLRYKTAVGLGGGPLT